MLSLLTPFENSIILALFPLPLELNQTENEIPFVPIADKGLKFTYWLFEAVSCNELEPTDDLVVLSILYYIDIYCCTVLTFVFTIVNTK